MIKEFRPDGGDRNWSRAMVTEFLKPNNLLWFEPTSMCEGKGLAGNPIFQRCFAENLTNSRLNAYCGFWLRSVTTWKLW